MNKMEEDKKDLEKREKNQCDYIETCTYPKHKRSHTFCRFGRYGVCKEYQRLEDLKK